MKRAISNDALLMKAMIRNHEGGKKVEMSSKTPPRKIFTKGPINETLARILFEGFPYQITAPGAIILKAGVFNWVQYFRGMRRCFQ